MRQIVLDTETTGLSPAQGHRLTEIGCVELINRKVTGNEFQVYLNPERVVDERSIEITGLTNEFLADKPLFIDIVDNFIEFIGEEVEIIIHNAEFDLGFLRSEFAKINKSFDDIVLSRCEVIDTLMMARKMYPGQKNSLDALCNRLDVISFDRDKHGALLDSQILAEVYLKLTGGQFNLFEKSDNSKTLGKAEFTLPSMETVMAKAHKDDLTSHQEFLDFIEKSNNIKALWAELEKSE